MFMGKSTISMAMFNSFLFVYQRVFGLKPSSYLHVLLTKMLSLMTFLTTMISWGVWTPRPQRDVTTKDKPGRGEKIGGFPEIDMFKGNHAKLLFLNGKASEHVVFFREITRNWEVWSLVIPILSTISHVE